MVLRVWIEDGSSEPLRVHVRQTDDLSRGSPRATTLTDVDEVVATVRRFLDSSRAAGTTSSDGRGDADG